MGNAKHSQIFSPRSLGFLVLLLTAFTATDVLASGCVSEAKLDEGGAYTGCTVRMGNREFSVGKERSSKDGCAQVCNIMAEVNGSRRGKKAFSTASRE